MLLFENEKVQVLVGKIDEVLLPLTESLYTLNFKMKNWLWNCFSPVKPVKGYWVCKQDLGVGRKECHMSFFFSPEYILLFFLFCFDLIFCFVILEIWTYNLGRMFLLTVKVPKAPLNYWFKKNWTTNTTVLIPVWNNAVVEKRSKYYSIFCWKYPLGNKGPQRKAAIRIVNNFSFNEVFFLFICDITWILG